MKQVCDWPSCALSAMVFAGFVVVGAACGEDRLERQPGTRSCRFGVQQLRALIPAVLVGAI